MKKITTLLAFACLTMTMQAQIFLPGDRTFHPAKIVLQCGESFEALARIPFGGDVYYRMDNDSPIIRQRDRDTEMRYILYMPENSEPFLIERISWIANATRRRPTTMTGWWQVKITGPVNLYVNYFGVSGVVRQAAIVFIVRRAGEAGIPMFQKDLTVGTVGRSRTNRYFYRQAAEYFATYPQLAERISLRLPGYRAEDIVEIVREYNARMSQN